MSTPGTSFASRLLAGRFALVDPRAVGEVGEDVVPVFEVGSNDDRHGLLCRPVVAAGTMPNVAAENAYFLFEVFPTSDREYVLRSVWVRQLGGGVGFFELHGVATGALVGGVVQGLHYREGGVKKNVASVRARTISDTQVGVVGSPQESLDKLCVIAGTAQVARHLYEDGAIIVRPGEALALFNLVVNEASGVQMVFTERPLSAPT